MNRVIEGEIVRAEPEAAAFGEQIINHVVVRRRDGSEIVIDQVRVARHLGHVLTPASTGRFHFQSWMGVQGLYAFAPAGTCADVAFPMHVERGFAIVAVLNLVLVALWLEAEAGLPLVPLTIGVLATSLWAACRATRETLTHDLKYENRAAAARRSHRQAVMGV